MATDTFMKNLINPEVIGAYLDLKLRDNIRFAPLAMVETDLQGTPGNTITVPMWGAVKDAEDVAEGAESDVDNLQAYSYQATIKKIVKNIGITDEAVLSGHGNPVGEIGDQLLKAIAQKIDNDCLDLFKPDAKVTAISPEGGLNKHEMTMKTKKVKNLTVEALGQAQAEFFGEDLGEAQVLIVAPKEYEKLRRDPAFEVSKDQSSAVNISGVVGSIYNASVIISNKLAEKNMAIIVKPGAFGIEYKRGTSVETDRDVRRKKTLYSADTHYIAYLRNLDKCGIIQIETTTEPSGRRATSTAK